MGAEGGAIEAVGWREPPAAREERKLIREAQQGSQQSLADLYAVHWPRAHRAAYLVVHDSAAAEDIAQDAFLAAIAAIDRFDRRRPFAPGCTGSSSTARSIGGAGRRCAARSTIRTRRPPQLRRPRRSARN